MSELSFKIDVFEGPLDLLLHLISKNKVSICDIPISTITDQYFEYLELMQKLDMELGGEFLVMASQLLYIKSKMLLPKPEEEEDDPRAELADRLEEYKRYKEISAQMDKLSHSMEHVVFKGAEPLNLPKIRTENKEIPIERLFEAFFTVIDRSASKKPIDPKTFKRVIGRTNYSVRTASKSVMSKIKMGERTVFEDLFTGLRVRGEYVATFLALLELIKENAVTVTQEGGKLYCLRGENNVELDNWEEY
ncbi:MAG: segregation/condensation protein A [Clostridia bacterium]|nr:segregation/condensation protein A [Clostridia bacterium]